MTSSGVRHLNYFVENMDCADCVRKVERLVGNLPGTADVKTSFARQTLELDLDESQTAVAVLERHLRELGYPPQSLVESGGEGSVAGASPAAEQAAPWYAGGQGRLVLVSGALLALAWVACRLLYGACYLANLAALRSALWIAASGCVVALFVSAA